MRVSFKRLSKVISLCLILTTCIGILLNNMSNVQEQKFEKENYFGQGIAKVLDATNSYKSQDVIVRWQRSAKGLTVVQGDVHQNQIVKLSGRSTSLEDIFISIKTTAKYHKTRLNILLDTWISRAKNQVIIKFCFCSS